MHDPVRVANAAVGVAGLPHGEVSQNGGRRSARRADPGFRSLRSADTDVAQDHDLSASRAHDGARKVSRSSRFKTLPLAFLGRAVAISIRLGRL